MVFNEHRFAQSFFVDGLIGNGQAALLAVRTKIFDQIGNEFLALSRGKRTRNEARTRVVIWVLHQIDARRSTAIHPTAYSGENQGRGT